MSWFEMLHAAHPAKNIKFTPGRINRWRRQALIDCIRGKRYGESFCDYFGVQDYIMQFERDEQRVNHRIETVYARS